MSAKDDTVFIKMIKIKVEHWKQFNFIVISMGYPDMPKVEMMIQHRATGLQAGGSPAHAIRGVVTNLL